MPCFTLSTCSQRALFTTVPCLRPRLPATRLSSQRRTHAISHARAPCNQPLFTRSSFHQALFTTTPHMTGFHTHARFSPRALFTSSGLVRFYGCCREDSAPSGPPILEW